MKKLYCFTGLLFCLGCRLFSQDVVIIKGIVKCFISDDERSTRGARNVVVVPGFIPQKSGMTGDQGYFEINTGVPIRMLEDKYVSIYFISSCSQCTKKVNVFVSSEQATTGPARTISYITVPTLKMNAGCKKTEPDPIGSDKLLNSYTSQPGIDLAKASPLNVLTAPPGLLNLLTKLVTIPAEFGISSSVNDTATINPGNIHGYGKFLSASPMILTANTGFNFAPSRDRSEAVFWNPAALGGSSRAGSIDVFANFKNNFKLSGYKRIDDKLTVGLGGIYTVQSEFRETVYPGMANPVMRLQTLKEFAGFLSAGYKLNKDFSVGLALKYIHQGFNLPDSVTIPASQPVQNIFLDRMISKQQIDADLSFSYNITPSLKAGINIMNLAGSQLYADAFALQQKVIPTRDLRSFGLGLSYKLKQFNFGADALYADKELYDVSVGANYVPFNNSLLSAGFAFRQKSFSASFKWKQFKISYVDDNGYLVNEKNPGNARILSGRIYTGVIFDF